MAHVIRYNRLILACFLSCSLYANIKKNKKFNRDFVHFHKPYVEMPNHNDTCTYVWMDVIIESVDSISKDERGFPLTQYITNGRISRARYTITHFKHHHRVLRLIFYRMSV